MSLLNDRFEIIDELGRGAQAVTYKARDHRTDEIVALKELDVRKVADWKAHELFQREAETLRGLDHPAIPRYIDAFVVDGEDEVRLFLAQEYADGPTLEQELKNGARWDEAQILDDLVQLLDALAYLHQLSPPVIHRDIKPSNIVRRSDGRLALIDFGAVQNALPSTVGGSTIIGTPGYMPIEQLMGRAVPATDLYALGATCVRLLSRQEPSSLDVVRNRMQFREHVRVSPRLQEVLECLLEPSAEDRYYDAGELLGELRPLLKRVDNEVSPGPEPEMATDREEATDFALRLEPHRPVERFPRWATVTPQGDDRFVIEFDMRDFNERALAVRIAESPDGLRVEVRPRRTAHQVLIPVAMCVAVILVSARFGPLMVTVAIMALAAVAMPLSLRNRREANDLELEVQGQSFTLETAQEVVRGSTARIADSFFRDHTLYLDIEGEKKPVPLLSVSAAEAYRERWLEHFFDQRVARMSGSVALDFASSPDAERDEFWKEEPASVKAPHGSEP